MSAAQVLLAYDPDQVRPGWVAFFLVMALIVATFLLWRSMNTQLGRIKMPPSPSTRHQLRLPQDDDEPDPPAPR